MNQVVPFSIGVLMTILGVMFTVPAIVDVTNDNLDWQAFAFSAAISVFIGVLLMVASMGQAFSLGRREGYVLTVGSWLSMSLMAALPFWLSGQGISFTDAVFEAVSGLTTTGSTILTGLDAMPPGLLAWRAILQWIGGIGIIVMAVTLMPFLRVGGMQLYRLETSDQYDKITPRIADVCLRIMGVYVVLSLACALVYWLLGMTAFEAFIHAMTTISTGGYSTSDQSLGHFGSAGIEWAAVVFMLAGSLPFSIYIRFLHRLDTKAFTQDSQTPAFLGYTLVFVALFTIFLALHHPGPILDNLRMAAFSIVSVITTTGYASGDYLTWGQGVTTVFLFLTLLGGCAGSTAGGLKTFRLLTLYKEGMNQTHYLQYPHGLFRTQLGARPVSADNIRSVHIFFFVMMGVLSGITLALSLTGLDFTTSISAAATSIANVGPGLGQSIGPSGNFAELSDPAKWIMDLGMLAGRLEFLTILVLFLPNFWSDI